MNQDDKESQELAKLMLNVVHNLDLAVPGNEEIAREYTLDFLRQYEKVRSEAYDDGTYDKKNQRSGKPIRLMILEGEKIQGSITIGIGFNMQRLKNDPSYSQARHEWAAVLPDISFDKAIKGKIELSPEQINLLGSYSVNIRIKELRDVYGSDWDKFRPNEQMAIISAYYSGGPKVVGKNTNFYKHMKNYAKTGDTKYLGLAIVELRDKSNPPDKNKKKSEGIQRRRNGESIVLDSTQAHFKNPINQPKLPVCIRVIPGETIVPLGSGKNWAEDVSSKYYIWRCVLDGNTRGEHLAREGKAYHRDVVPPPVEGYHGCRCKPEPVTVNLMISEPLKQNIPKIEYGRVYPILEVRDIEYGPVYPILSVS